MQKLVEPLLKAIRFPTRCASIRTLKQQNNSLRVWQAEQKDGIVERSERRLMEWGIESPVDFEKDGEVLRCAVAVVSGWSREDGEARRRFSGKFGRGKCKSAESWRKAKVKAETAWRAWECVGMENGRCECSWCCHGDFVGHTAVDWFLTPPKLSTIFSSYISTTNRNIHHFP